MATTKTTKREYINRILTYVHDEDKPYLLNELALLDKKSTAEKKPTAVQVANEGIKSAICDWMTEGVTYTAADVAKECPACEGLTVQRVSALLSQLGKSGALTVTEEKRKHYYSIGE